MDLLYVTAFVFAMNLHYATDFVNAYGPAVRYGHP